MTPTGTATEQDGTITEDMVENMAIKVAEAQEKAVFNPKAYHGKRTIGRRKMQLLGRLQMQANRLKRLGLNPEYALATQTDWKGPIKTRTKDITGIISQLKALE